MLLELSIMLLELSIMLLENIYSIGYISHDDNMFIVQAAGPNVIKKTFDVLNLLMLIKS